MSAIINGGGGGGSGSFSTLTGGTNTGNAFVVGNGSSISTSGTGTITAPPVFPVNAQTASYNVTAGDFSSFKTITMNGASLTLTLLATAPTTSGQGIFVENLSTSTLTIANNTRNIDGVAANITIPQNVGIMIVSDGTNYVTNRGGAGSLALTPTASQTVQSPSGTSILTSIRQDAASTGGSWFIIQDGSGARSLLAAQTNAGNYQLSVTYLTLTEQAATTGIVGTDNLYGDNTTHTISHNSNNNGIMSFSGAWVNTNVTPVTVNANVSTAQNLMSVSIPAGTLNRVGRSLRIWSAGVYTIPTSAGTSMTLAVKLGALTLYSITTTSLTTGVTNGQFNINSIVSVQTGGASGALEAHANLSIELGATGAVADSLFLDGNTATVSTVDLTAAQTLQVTITFSAASASNTATQRQMVLETVG
jgi:hypothetical protein